MTWTFPPLPGPCVFIAAPADLAYLRRAAVQEFETLRAQVADIHGVEVYDWVDDKAESGFKDWIPPQGQIPLPSDPKCRAVICMLGERIGTPLPETFDTSALGSLDKHRSDGFGLVHRWREDAAAEGGFALTGTVFEYLAALQSNDEQGLRGVNIDEGRPPVLLLLVGDDSILTEDDPLCTSWGNCDHREEIKSSFQDKYGRRGESEYRKWEQAEHFPQLKQLGNFARFLRARGLNLNIVANREQACARIRAFLLQALNLQAPRQTRDPFKGLSVYEPEDNAVYFGREEERSQAVRKLRELWNDRARPTFFGVIGGSGVGKSSFVRAGVVGHLCHHAADGHYLDCVVRPTDLLSAGNAAPRPLLALYLRALNKIEPGRDHAAAVQALAEEPEERQASRAVQRLAQALEASRPETRLLIAFDQFEELLDQYVQPATRPLWLPVIQFIVQATAQPAMGVVYTLQANRSQLLMDDTQLGPLCARAENRVLAFPRSGLDEIISKPFHEARGIQLEPALARKLRDRILKFTDAVGGETQGSLLPLVSLTLQRIFQATADDVVARAAPAAASAEPSEDLPEAADRRPTSGDEPTPTLRLADCEHLLDVAGAIAQLADEAVAEARASSGAAWSDDVAGSLLRRLVRLRDSTGDRLELPPALLPAKGPMRRLADALIARRLLLPEADGRVRLVHEAVVEHWPTARKWRGDETQLLKKIRFLEAKAGDWHDQQCPPRMLDKAGEGDVDDAAEVLALWVDVLDGDAAVRDAKDTRLREYALALLGARPMPGRIVEASQTKTRHVHLVTNYGRLDLLQVYIERERGCVHVQREDLRTPLFGACFNGRLDLIEALLQAGAAHGLADKDGWQPIHAAASSGHWPVIERLLRAGPADSLIGAAGSEWRSTPLHLAALNNHADLVSRLLALPACRPNLQGRYGWTALHNAAQEGHDAIIRMLQAAPGVQLDARLDNDWTALHIAALNGRATATRTLIELDAGLTELTAKNDWAAEDERKKRPADAPWQQLGWTALHVAVANDRAEVARELLACRANPDAVTADRRTPLLMAVAAGNEIMVALLLEHKPALELRDDKERTALHLALSKDDFAIATRLAEAGADIEALRDGVSPLCAETQAGSEARVEFLLKRGADTTRRVYLGRAPLHLAAAAGKIGLLRLLLEGGADGSLPDAAGRTALHLAVTSGTTETVAWLVQRPEVDVQRPDPDGMTALHVAAQAGRAEALALLLPKSGDIDTVDGDGWTALMLAAQGGHAAVVETLLLAGADPRHTATRPVMNALQAAAEVGQTSVVDALLTQEALRAELDTGTSDKPPVLVLAVRNAQFDTALRLLDAGAKVRAETHDPDLLLAAVLDDQQRRAALALPMIPAASGLMRRLVEAGAQRPAPNRSLLDRASAASAFMTHESATPLPAAPRSVGDRGVLHYAWLPVLDDWYDAVLRWVNPIDGKLPALPQSTLVEYTRLPWYDDVVLLKLTDRNWQPANLAIYYLAIPAAAPTALYRLNGTSPPIHEVNAKAPIRLDESNVLAYMRFFCFFVRGNEGPFYVLETPDDPLIPRDVDPKVAALLKDTVRPATFEHREKDGKYFCRAVIWYSNAIFVAEMSVHGSGMVDMLGDEPVAGDLPTRIDAPIA